MMSLCGMSSSLFLTSSGALVASSLIEYFAASSLTWSVLSTLSFLYLLSDPWVSVLSSVVTTCAQILFVLVMRVFISLISLPNCAICAAIVCIDGSSSVVLVSCCFGSFCCFEVC